MVANHAFYKLYNKPFVVEVWIEKVQVDTGSACSCISDSTFKEHFKHKTLDVTGKQFYFYNGSTIKPLGCFNATVTYNKIKRIIDFYVIENGGPSSCGYRFFRKI